MEKMIKGLEVKVDSDLSTLSESRWSDLVKEESFKDLEVSAETLQLMKVIYQLGYQQGNKDLFIQLKDIYESDIDLLEKTFEDDES